MTVYQQTQSSLQLGLRVGGCLGPAQIHSSDPSELFRNGNTTDTNNVLVIIIITMMITDNK